MGILDSLVVGVDGSDASRTALSWATDRVSPAGTVHAVTVRDGTCRMWPDHGPPKSSVRAGEAAGGPSGESSRSSAASEVRTETVLADGDTTDELLRVADEVKADAIVVGPHSKPGNLGILGHVTRRLLQRAPIPLVVAKPPVGPGLLPGGTIRPVVACVGYGTATEQAALWAGDYAAARAKPLTLLHVVGYRPLFPADSPSDMLASYFGRDVLREWAEEDLDEIGNRIEARNTDLRAEIAVEVGFASREILAAAEWAELLVLGKRQGNAALRSFISPRVRQLIIKSTATVAVVPSCFTST